MASCVSSVLLVVRLRHQRPPTEGPYARNRAAAAAAADCSSREDNRDLAGLVAGTIAWPGGEGREPWPQDLVNFLGVNRMHHEKAAGQRRPGGEQGHWLTDNVAQSRITHEFGKEGVRSKSC